MSTKKVFSPQGLAGTPLLCLSGALLARDVIEGINKVLGFLLAMLMRSFYHNDLKDWNKSTSANSVDLDQISKGAVESGSGLFEDRQFKGYGYTSMFFCHFYKGKQLLLLHGYCL